MDKQSRIKELEDLIIFHKNLYYSGKKKIEDEEYDELENQLKSLDPNNFALFFVGYQIKSDASISHSTKMLSLDKVYEVDKLIKWQDDNELVATLKIDGSSCSLVYSNNIFNIAKTRGDGVTGENITSKCLFIDFPKKITKKTIEIRGEIFCNEDDFFALSEEMEKRGLEKPRSQRNIVAGILGRKDHQDLAKFLKFMAFEVISDDFKTEMEKFDFLKKNKFILPNPKKIKTKKELETYLKETQDKLVSNNFLIDGAVFCLNKIELQKEKGYTNHHPKYKMAFKFQGETKNTKIKSIDWQISQFGVYTPVANLEPVELKGVVISKVTLHNYKTVKEFNLKEGDEIKIVRSGEVIPKFLELIKSSNKKQNILKKCIYCESNLISDTVRLICPNKKNCNGIKKETLLNFIVKIGIDDLSEKRLEQMIEHELIVDIPDLYRISKEDLLSLPNTKDKMATKLYENIQKSKQVDIIKFFDALGFIGGAKNKLELIIESGFDSLTKINKLTVKELLKIKGFAETSAHHFINSLQDKSELIDELIGLGFEIIIPKQEVQGEQLKGELICITGDTSVPRKTLEQILKSFGANTTSSISSKTTILINNDKDSSSSKNVKAKELNVKIYTEKELKEFFKFSY
jgi:DNA ligase (NAD+)